MIEAGALLEGVEATALDELALGPTLARLDRTAVEARQPVLAPPAGFDWAPPPLRKHLAPGARWRRVLGGFEEIRLGAAFYCLHKNKWWQTSRGPMLDAGGFVAGLEYATGVEATVLGKPSPSYFAAALDALDAEPELTWLVTDDVEADVRGARLFGMRTAVVRTGKFRPETLETTDASPDIIVSSLAQFPALLEQDLSGGLTR